MTKDDFLLQVCTTEPVERCDKVRNARELNKNNLKDMALTIL